MQMRALQQRSASGAGRCSGRQCVRPFTASKVPVRPAVQQQQLVARTAAPEAPVAQDSAAVDDLAPLFTDDEEQQAAERVMLDDEDRLAVSVAEEVMPFYALEAVLEGELDQNMGTRAGALLENELEQARGVLPRELADAAEVLAASASEAAELEEVEDYQGPAGFLKYDEQEEASIPDENYEAMQRLKLTRNELANLLPADWDTVNVDWFTNQREDNIPLPDYKLTFLWQTTNIAVAVDQVYARGQTSPLTEYFVWPRKDAWEDLKTALEGRPFVSERDKVILLNRLTQVINFWQQDKAKPTLEQARAAFPDCAFI